MKRLVVFCFFFSCSMKSFSQTGKLTGSVIDAEIKTPLELATVSIFHLDSSLVTYQLSDKNGRFSFEKLPLKKKLFINITYTGYISHQIVIQLEEDKTETLDASLKLNNNDTNTVTVTATIPIRMNGDTLEINPAAFKMKGDAVVEELLNQVSGMTVWSDGTITVNGKKVQNLFVDGKPFMGSTDARVATQNLPKTAIDKIQLYQEYDRSKIGQVQQPQDSLLTMNIKLKESSKKGYFGKVGIGLGTRERFESDLSLQIYNKQSSAGIGGGFNNINKNIGNLQDMFQNNTYRNYNPNLYNVGRFGTNGINKNHSVGSVVTHSFIQEANSRQNNRITVNYNKSGTDAYITDLNLQGRTTIANPQFIREEGIQNNRNNKHELGINYFRANGYNDNLSINGVASSNNEKDNSSRYTEVKDTANALQSTAKTTTLQDRQSDNESLNGSFAKSNIDDPLKSFSIQFDARRGNTASNRDVQTIFQSFTDANKNTSYNRRYATNNNTINLGGTLDYTGFKRMLLGRYNLFGVDLRLAQRINYTRTFDNSRVHDYDSAAKQYNINNSLSNRNKKEVFEYEPSLILSKSFYKSGSSHYRNIYVQAKVSEDIKTEKNLSSLVKRNLDRGFHFFRYEGNLSYSYQRQQKFNSYWTVSYIKNFEYPSIDQLYTIVDDINVYDIRIGNAGLKNRSDHRLNLNGNFNTQNPKSAYSINSNINGSYTHLVNSVSDSIVNDFSGKRTSYYINADKSNSLFLNYSFNISRRLKKSNLQLMYNGQFRSTKLPNYIDSRYNISQTDNLSNQFTLQFSLRSTLVVNLAQTIQRYKTQQTAAGLTSFKNSNNSTKLGIVLNSTSNLAFSSTIENIDNSNLKKPTILWNAFTTYRFMKQQGELKFSAMDLLKQYQNIINSVNSLGTTTRITNGLQQFFLLTFSYYPRKFGKAEIKKPGVQQ
jgi:hypothetical protein